MQYVDVQRAVPANALCSGLVGEHYPLLRKFQNFQFLIFSCLLFFVNADDVVTPQGKETGLMDALLEAGGVRTMFVGHEHGNLFKLYCRKP